MSIHLARVYSEAELRTQVRHAVQAMGHATHRATTATDPTARAQAQATAARLSALAFDWHTALAQVRQRNTQRSRADVTCQGG